MKIRNQSFAMSVNKHMRIVFSILLVLGTFAMPATFAQSSSNTVNSVICNTYFFYNSIDTAIFIVGLALMILGGAMYAGSHMMPGQSKGTMQGYGMGMVLGGVIGIVIAVVAPFLFSLISGLPISSYSYNPSSGVLTAPNPANSGVSTQYTCS